MSPSVPAIKPMPRQRFLTAIREIFYGMTAYEFERQALELRGSLENVLITALLGDMLGLPVAPPVYALRVLPYVVPQLQMWKRRVAREREIFDSEELDLHGV